MKIASIRRWHWMAMGALAGLAIAYGQFSTMSEKNVGLGDGKMTQIEFEREVRLPPVEGMPHLSEIKIYPRDGYDRVEMKRLRLMRLGSKYEAAFYIADRPYVSRGRDTAPAANYTVREFIAGTMPKNVPMKVEYAWWEARTPRVVMGSVMGILVVGGIWPMLLRMIGGAAIARKKEEEAEEEVTVEQPKIEPVAVEIVSGPSPEAIAHLRELEEEMIRNLKSKIADVPAEETRTVGAAAKQEIKELSGDEEVKPVVRNEEQHDYKGEFYPVDRGKHPHGFTLVELLVVIGIIALLLSILLPVLAGVRQQAQQVKCMAQLKQLGNALHMYALSNKGSMPSWSAWQTYPDGGTSEDSPGLGWTELLAPYFVKPDSPIYNCPSFPGPVPMRNYFLAAKWAGKRGRNATKFSEIKYSSCFVVSGDKTQMSLYPAPSGTAQHVYDDADPDDFGDDKTIMAWPWEAGGFWMHRGGNNVLFADDHVNLFKRYDRSSMTFSATEMQDWSEVN